VVGVGPWQGQPAYLSEFVLPETSHCCCVRELHSWMKPTGFRSRASAREGEVVMMGLGSGLGVGSVPFFFRRYRRRLRLRIGGGV